MYTLYREIHVDTSVQKAWTFICNPGNLNQITPPDMAFRILTKLPEEMYEGMQVEYRVRIPFMGRRRWISELKNIIPRHSFVDVQLSGPYRHWHHFHSIEETDCGILLTDHITYDVPYGIFGRIAHVLFIRKTLNRIFDYRERRFKELLHDPDNKSEKIRFH